MEREVLIEVNNISKKFCKDLKTSLSYGVRDSFSALLPFKQKAEKKLRPKEFWAVQDISFTLKRGECIGLIGHNGAGKSTLLKMINGLINPDLGSIKLKGKVGALIELGAGFNPILTGRENIYNNAAVLGFSKKEIDDKMEEIIKFSEIEDFLDTPLQNFSSGMKVRLGFAVAAHLEPDILIIDEVLAVGDLGFVLKCFQTIDKLLPNTAVIFVSHSMPMVSRICNQIMLIDKGKVKYQGEDVSKGIDLYYSKFSQNSSNVVFDSNYIEYIGIEVNGNNLEKKIPTIIWNDDLEFKLRFKNLKLNEIPHFQISIFDKEQRGVALLNNTYAGNKQIGDEIEVKVTHKNIQLSKGIYNINISVTKKVESEPILRINNVGSIHISADRETWPPFLLDCETEIINTK